VTRSKKARRGAARPSTPSERGQHRPPRAGAIHQAGVWLVAAAAALLPLAFDPSSQVAFALPKAEVLGVLAYALAAALALTLLTKGWRAIPTSWVHVPVGVYLAIVVTASIFAVDRNLALWGTYDRRLGLVSSLQLGVLYLAAATFVRNRRETATVLLGAAGGAAIVLSYALLERFGLDPIRWSGEAFPSSTLGNSNITGHYFATLAAASVAVLMALFPWSGRRRIAIALAALCAAFVLGAVLSGARAPLLGFVVGVVEAVGITAWRMMRDRRGRTVAIGLAFGGVLLTGALVLLTPAGARIATVASGTDLSVVERSLIYETVVEIVRDHPLLGVGPDNFPAVYNVYRPLEALRFGALITQSSAHGWPWRVALDSGLAGLLVFAALAVTMGVVAARRLRHPNDWRVPLLAVALVTYLAGGVFTVNDLGTEWMFWLAAGLLVGVGTAVTTRAVSARPLRGARAIVAIALAVGFLWPLIALVSDIGASRALVASRAAQRDPVAALALARKAADADGRWPAHWNNLGLRALDAGDRASALAAFEHAAQVGPYDPLIWKNLGTIQAQLAATQPRMGDRARQSAARAVAADPRNPEAHAGAAQIYVILGDGEAAAREAEVALSVAPGNDTYLELAANGYLQAGRTAEARAAIQRALAVHETWQRRFLLARVDVVEKKYPEARIELRRVLELNPGNRNATALLDQLVGR